MLFTPYTQRLLRVNCCALKLLHFSAATFSSKMAKELKLSSGGKMPIIGLGTWQSTPEEVKQAVETAIDCGYRLIDTAFAYANEKSIGEAIAKKIKEGKVKREDLFITTKLHMQYLEKNLVRKCITKSLADLGLDYVDLYLVHGPMKMKLVEDKLFVFENGKMALETVDHLGVWEGMEEVYRAGLAKSIGLSNFNSKQIKRIYDHAKIKPSNLQVECHAHFPQVELHNFCKQLGITFTAYAPLGSPNRAGSQLRQPGQDLPAIPRPFEDPKVVEIANAHKKTPAQVLLRWLIQREIAVIPKSITPARIRENFDVFNFQLSDAEMKTMANLGVNKRSFDFVGMLPEGANEFPFHEPF